MKSTGVVRKIDDLGRIVIPKEIRKSLGIRDGENLEIVVEDNNIKLSKKNIVNNYLNDIKELLIAAEIIFPGLILLTDREKVTLVTRNDFDIKPNDKLSNELMQTMDYRMTFNDDIIQKHMIEGKELVGYFLIYPILDDGNSLGLVIFYSDKSPIKEYDILVKFLTTVLKRKLDIS